MPVLGVLAVGFLGALLGVMSSAGCQDCHYTYGGEECLDLPEMSTGDCPSREDALTMFSPPDADPPSVVSVESDGTLTGGKSCCYQVMKQHYCE